MIYLFILGIAALGTAFYLLIMYGSIPGAVSERFGELEVPDQLDRWVTEEGTEAAMAAQAEGLRREVRVLLAPKRGLFGSDKLVHQSRYRDLETNEIARVDPDRVVPRRRRK